MRPLIAACLILVGPLAQAVEPHYSKAEVRKGLIAVVDAQLVAFRAENFAQAHQLAAAPLRAQFPLKEFTAMVTHSYPLIAHNERAEFGLATDDGSTATLSVKVFGPDGRSGDYSYMLVQEDAGWRISGVVAEKPRPADI